MKKRDPKTGRFIKSVETPAPAKKETKVQSKVAKAEPLEKVLELPLEVFQKKDMSGNPITMRTKTKVSIVKTSQLHGGKPICRIKRETSSRTFYTTEDKLS